ncbi:High-affinity nicotinic acid transporter [Purpureocillium lavendulum]|uniref:High-affinity nicotinic acid transporter n=1 Tax=Purpureocillium lavendulum TaxID=1247861 RepID=A0AB34FRJ4_9HYPO|nr:High-affinity nicotinic acid transporter [Purpureocillium lavendulum]
MALAGRAETESDDANHVNLSVLIPVIIVLGVFAFLFFGCLGLPWQQFLGRKTRYQPQRPHTYKLDPIIEAELANLEAGRGLASAAYPPGNSYEMSPLHSRQHGSANDSAEASRVTFGPEATPWDPTASDAAAARRDARLSAPEDVQAPPPAYTAK